MDLEALKYPIGKFQKPETITSDDLLKYISVIELFPHRLDDEVEQLSNDQLETPYRPDGWTIKQVVHHCADSHMNALVRFKLALTEDKPTIKPYKEALWADLADSSHMSIDASLNIISGIHMRWAALLKSLTKAQWKRTFVHPQHGREISLEENAGLYAWHCQHHLAHITGLKQRNEWI